MPATAPATTTSLHRLGHGIGMDITSGPTSSAATPNRSRPACASPTSPASTSPTEFGIRLEDDWHLTPEGGKLFTPQSPSLEQPFG